MIDQTSRRNGQMIMIPILRLEKYEAGIMVLGISYDFPESHQKFKEQHRLVYTLVNDEDKKVAKAYGVYGRWMWFLISRRYTYQIDENVLVIHIFKKVNVNRQVEEMLEVFKNVGN
jgi:peroxiredoxin Q/BCP